MSLGNACDTMNTAALKEGLQESFNDSRA